MSKTTSLGVSTVIWAVLFGLAVAGSYAQTPAKPRRAPMNPEFVECLRARALGKAAPRTADGHALGEVPPPFRASGVRPGGRAFDRGTLPSAFDLRTAGNKLSAVRDQGACGSCWAFATYGSLESYLLPGETADLAEQDLIDNAGFSLGPCDGGNIDMSTAYLARWAGPLDETDDPYVYLAAYPGSTASAVRKHVQNVVCIPERASAADNDLLKAEVMVSGAVYVSMYWVDSGWNTDHSSFYNNGAESGGGGHAVCIVGWNDAYPAANFNTAAPGDGAFIVRNSWGPSWGEAGYFYVSYYDTEFARRWYNGAVRAEGRDNFSGVFQYDPLGWCDSWGYGADTAWGANVFTAPTRTSVSAVGFYAVSANCSYEILVYTGATSSSPRAGTLRASTSGALVFPGYFTIPLPSPVTVAAGQKFSVVVRFTTPGYGYPVPAEERLGGYSEAAVAHGGESFISPNGTSWFDLMKDPSYTPYMINFCIKAFTATVPTITVTSPAAGARWMRGTTQTIAWTKSGTQADSLKIQLYQGTLKVSDISLSTENDGVFDWTIPSKLAPRADYILKVTTTDGKARANSAKFAVVKPTLTVTSPAADAVWTRGTIRPILWTKDGLQNDFVLIQLLRYGALVREISAGTANGGTFDWPIPENLPRGGGYKVRVKTVGNLVKDDSGIFNLN